MKEFTFIDLFSGIGGFHLALGRIGGKCVFASDIDETANQTYFQNFGIKPYGDIKAVQAKKIPEADLLCAGFPCQSYSQIGPGGGINDPRGELIYDVFRILREKQNKAFILENVRGLMSHDKGKTFNYIIQFLESLNYKVYHELLEAKNYGLPQIRKRLFIVGVHKSINKEFKFPEPIPLQYTLSDVMKGKAERDYAFTIRIGGRNSGINNRFNWDAYMVDGKVRIITPQECLLVQGFDKGFKLAGNKDKQYKQVGNSVPVKVIEMIGRELTKRGII